MLRITGTSSGVKTASEAIYSGSSWFLGVDIKSPTTGTTILTVYDSEDSNTSGKTVISEVEVDAGLGSLNHEFVHPVYANKGIYVSFSGQTTNYIVRFAPA